MSQTSFDDQLHRLAPATGWWRSLAAMLLATTLLAASAFAQSDDDPPARVGRISVSEGEVTLSDGSTEWSSPLNWPITSGRSVRTGAGSRAEVRVGSLALRLDAETLVDFTRIDDQSVAMTVQWGAIGVRVRNREMLPQIDIVTPRERIAFDDLGRYRIEVDRPDGITGIAAFTGTVRVNASAVQFTVSAGQRMEVSGAPVSRLQQTTLVTDPFDDWTLALDRRDDAVRSTQYVSAEMTGVESLDQYGRWNTVEDYGAVWFPTTTPAGWVPYRNGRWAYVSPWGWTWIDEAPWGFAPFHYGRWVSVGGSWGWVPGRPVPRPVYAPALVAWIGAPGGAVSVGAEPVGWFPLAPWDVYAPPYRHSRNHLDAVNRSYGGVRPPPPHPYRDPSFVTWVPAGAIRDHAPINRQVTVPPPRWARAPVMVAPPVAPPPPGSPMRRPGFDGPDKRHPTNPVDASSVTRLPPERPRPANGGPMAPARGQPGVPITGAPISPADRPGPQMDDRRMPPRPAPIAPVVPMAPVAPSAPIAPSRGATLPAPVPVPQPQPRIAPAPQYTPPQNVAPQYTPPQHTPPQHTPPQHTAPQGAPPQRMPQQPAVAPPAAAPAPVAPQAPAPSVGVPRGMTAPARPVAPPAPVAAPPAAAPPASVSRGAPGAGPVTRGDERPGHQPGGPERGGAREQAR